MPAREPLPVLGHFLAGFEEQLAGDEAGALRPRRGGTADLASGSAALLWTAEAHRDQGLFRQCYTATASGDALERQVERRYGVPRIKASYGSGKLTLQRATAGASDTIDAGTRVEILGSPSPAVYAVAADTLVPSSALLVEVMIRATRTGPGVACNVSSGIRLADSVFDPGFLPVALLCADGADDEPPAAYVARARAEARKQRVGYRDAVEAACVAAGAATVVVMDPGMYGDALDQGITNVYVADSAFVSTDELLDAAMIALDDVRVAGCDAQVLGMEPVAVSLAVAVTLWTDPAKFGLLELRGAVVAALLDAFGKRPEWWGFDANALAGVAFDALRGNAQEVTVTSMPAPPAAGFLPVLPRYTLAGTHITITFSGPS